MTRTRSARRLPPSLFALILVVVATFAGVGLYVWGPVNPNVEVSHGFKVAASSPGVADWGMELLGAGGSWGSGQSVGTDGRVDTNLTVTNHSLATLRLTGVRIRPEDTTISPVPTIVRVDGVPKTIKHDENALVSVTVDARAFCAAHPDSRFTYRLLIDARTASGITRTLGGQNSEDFTCRADSLPQAGSAPVDADAAEAAVASAFATAYDVTATPEARRASVDDPAGLDPVVAAAQSGTYSAALTDVRVRIVEVVFTDPGHAAVLYDLVGDHTSYATGRIGHARLVDGHWKVTRATVCADLALASVHCPAP